MVVAFGIVLVSQPVVSALILTYVLGLVLAVSGFVRILLGITHWLMGVVWLGGVAAASGSLAHVLRRSRTFRRALDGVSGFVFVALALRLLFIERKPV